MHDHIIALLLTYIAFLFAVLSPGPNVLGILNTSLEKGRTAGVVMGVGIAFGSLTWATLTVIGLTQFIAKYSFLLQAVKIMGGLYLLFLAYTALKSSQLRHLEFNAKPANQPGNLSRRKHSLNGYCLRGYLLMMTNPKAALAWLAIMSLTTFSSGPMWLSVAAVTGTFTISLVAHVLFAIAFSHTSFAASYARYRGYLLKGFSVIYGGLGIKLLSLRN